MTTSQRILAVLGMTVQAFGAWRGDPAGILRGV